LADTLLPPHVSRDIIQETVDRLNEEISDQQEQIAGFLTNAEVQEMRGVAQISDDINRNTTQAYLEDKLKAIKLDTEYWKQKSQEAN
jgi:hypothetical protein